MAEVIKKVFILYFIFVCFPSSGQSLVFSELEKLPESVNSSEEESYPMLTPDGQTLFFSRTKLDSKGRFVEQKIWYSNRTEKGWSVAKDDFALNNKEGYTVIGFSSNGQTIYLSRTFSSGKINGIFFSKKYNNQWSKPIEIRIKNLNITSSFFGFYMHPSEKILLISMEGSSSNGKEDLYVSIRNDQEEWSEPIHLGNSINTSGYEISPFLSEDGKTLYFSSNGHGGMGNAEILRSTRLYDSWTLWTQPLHLSPSVNSENFDSYFSIFGNKAFFVSNRNKSYADIYTVKVDSSRNSLRLKLSDIEVENLFGFPIKRSFSFDKNSAEISGNDREILYFISNFLKDKGEYVVEIVGYADPSVEEKGKAVERAEKVKAAMLSAGLDSFKITRVSDNSQIPATKAEIFFYRI